MRRIVRVQIHEAVFVHHFFSKKHVYVVLGKLRASGTDDKTDWILRFFVNVVQIFAHSFRLQGTLSFSQLRFERTRTLIGVIMAPEHHIDLKFNKHRPQVLLDFLHDGDVRAIFLVRRGWRFLRVTRIH